MEQVEEVAAHGGHAGTTADVDHLGVGLLDKELPVGSADGALVAGLASEDVAGADAGVDVHPRVAGAVPRRSGNPDVEHHDVAFSRVVGHGVRADDGLVVDHLEVPQAKLVPLALEGVGVLVVLRVGGDVDVLVLHGRGRHVHLDVAAGLEVEGLALRQADDELLDEAGHVVVGDDLALPLLDAEDLFGDLDFHVLLDLHLATEAPVVGDFLAGEVGFFRREDGSATGRDLATALHAGATSTTGGGQEHAGIAEGGEQRAAAFHLEGALAIDDQLEGAAGGQPGLREQKQADQQQDDGQEERDGEKNRGAHDLAQISMPMKAMKAMPMRPVRMKVMPSPLSGAGMLE